MIRQEERQDYVEVNNLIKTAFDTAEHSDGTEQDLVIKLRESDAFISRLSLVSIINEKIVGHILFTTVKIGDTTQLALAPLSVLPSYQRQGVGLSLIHEGHKIAEELGYDYCIVLGSEHYYPKAGYLSAKEYGIYPSFEVPSQNFMAIRLNPNAQKITGTVEYAKEFGI